LDFKTLKTIFSHLNGIKIYKKYIIIMKIIDKSEKITYNTLKEDKNYVNKV